MAKKPVSPKDLNGFVLYALRGRSLDAAMRLQQELDKELRSVPVLKTGNLQEIGESWDAMYRGLLERLEREAPEVLLLTGLKAPAVQVFKGAQSLPRAYRAYPEIFLANDNGPEYFMYAPRDYKEEHFVPADAVLLKGRKEKRANDRLFAGGWLGNAPIVSIKKEGVATPADYVAPSESALRQAFSSENGQICYLAGGRSLEIVEDFRARTQEWERKIADARRAIEEEALKTKSQILLSLPAGEDVKIWVTCSYMSGGGDKAALLLYVAREGKNNLWDAGKRVDAAPSSAFHLEKTETWDFIVTPRGDTPEGKKIAALIDAIPLTPGLRDYPELYADFDIKHDEITRAVGVNGVVPQAIDLEGFTILLYRASFEGGEKSFCPPGAKPFPAEAYAWLLSDRGDRNMGVTRPPMPQSVSDILLAEKWAVLRESSRRKAAGP